MTLDSRNQVDLWVSMLDYLKGLLYDLPEFITGRSMIPESNHLFQVSPEDERTLLDEDQATAFHHTVAQLLCVPSRATKDINMDIAFLCTRVRIPDEYEQGKLVRVLRHIIGTLHLPLILRAVSLSVIKLWFNASFDAYPLYKGSTEAMMSMGPGLIMELSWKQEINGRVSMGDNIVGTDNDLPQ